MKITRNGVDYELTEQEMIEAFYEQQNKFDMAYISGNLIDLYNDGDYDEIQKQLLADQDLCSRVAYRYRKYIEDVVGSLEWSCFKDAWSYCKED